MIVDGRSVLIALGIYVSAVAIAAAVGWGPYWRRAR